MHRLRADAARLQWEPSGTVLCLHIPNSYRTAAEALVDDFSTHVGKVYDCEVKQHRERRSLSANAYCWVLCDEIAKAISVKRAPTTKEQIYRDQIKQVGQFVLAPIEADAAPEMIKGWASGRVGNMAEIIGPNSPGMVDVCFYRGSSTYDTEEMGRLLDNLIEEAKALGIDTRSPDEVARMKSLWEGE